LVEKKINKLKKYVLLLSKIVFPKKTKNYAPDQDYELAELLYDAISIKEIEKKMNL
jgi:hypothetical protein